MGNAIKSVRKSLARIFGCCLESQPPAPHEKSFSQVYPSISQDTKLSFTSVNDSSFIHIPFQTEIDKKINYYKDTQRLTEEEAIQIENTILELKQLRAKYSHDRANSTFETSSDLKSDPEHTPGSKEPDLSRFSFGPLHQLQEVSKACFVLEVQKGRFFWPEEARGLCEPSVQCRVVDLGADKTPTPDDVQAIETYNTTSAHNLLNPLWNQVFKYYLTGKYGIAELAFKIKLRYKREKSTEHVQIGSEQTFYFKELIDQQLRVKEIGFKSERSMGLIAKIGIRVQLITDADSLKKELLQQADYRIQQLNNIKKAHRGSFINRSRKGTLKVAGSYSDNSTVKNSISSDGSFILETNFYMT